jgi:hypothetical protein
MGDQRGHLNSYVLQRITVPFRLEPHHALLSKICDKTVF